MWQSLWRKDNIGEEDNTVCRKEYALRLGKRYVQTGEKILGNREKVIGLLVAAARPHIFGRAPLYLGAPALLYWSGRQHPIFIP